MKKIDYKSASFEKPKRTHAENVRLRYTTPQQAEKRVRKGA